VVFHGLGNLQGWNARVTLAATNKNRQSQAI
jgi:hypothetical protein